MSKKFSELERAVSLNNGDLFALAQVDEEAETGYKSVSSPVSDVAQKILKNTSFPTDLDTDSKTVLGAINEAAMDKNIANPYSNQATYAVGDFVIYQTVLYKCTTAVSVPEDFDPTKWTQAKVSDLVGYTKQETDDRFATIDGLNKAVREPLNLADAELTNNRINPLTWIEGNYINYNTGELVRDNNYITTDYIPVIPQKRYVSFMTNHYVWFDENKDYISGSNTVVNGLAPANAKYIRVDTTKVNRDLAFFRIGYVAPFDKSYGISYPWLDNTNPIKPERFNQWGAYYANLFNKYTAIDGYYVKHDTGERATSSTYFLSDYIKVNPSTVYVMSRGNRYAVYDSDYQYITGANLNGTDIEFTTPNNAAYLLVCNLITEKDNFVVAEKDVYSYSKESFGIVVPWLKPLVAKSKYDGKKLVCFGDSITFMGYTDTIKADTGIIAQNVGLSSGRYAYSDDSNQYINAFAFHNIVDSIVSGDWTIPDSINGISGYTNQYQQIQDIKAIDFNTIDFVSIAYGTNDFSSATPLDNQNDKYDTNTFKGAIRYCLKKLLEAFPNLKIIGVTPCYRFWSENDTILYDSDEHTIGGMYLSDYVEAVEEVYKEYHLPFVNNYDTAGINKYNRLQYFNVTDGLHPKLIGREILGHRIAEGILMNY